MMTTEVDPLEAVKEKLEEKTEPEPKSEEKEHEKTGEELHDIDVGVKKLNEEFSSWKTETKSTLLELKNQVTESHTLIRQLSEREPIKETVAIAPAPAPETLVENVDAQKAQKMLSKTASRRRFV